MNFNQTNQSYQPSQQQNYQSQQVHQQFIKNTSNSFQAQLSPQEMPYSNQHLNQSSSLQKQQQNISQQQQPFTQPHHHHQHQNKHVFDQHQNSHLHSYQAESKNFNPQLNPQRDLLTNLKDPQYLNSSNNLNHATDYSYRKPLNTNEISINKPLNQQQNITQQERKQLGQQQKSHTAQFETSLQNLNQSVQNPQITSNNTLQNASQGEGGRFQFEDGGCYAGKWQNGMAHGYGTCVTSSAGKTSTGSGEFSGLWQEGFELSGVYLWQNGETYEGQWLQGKKHGLGRETKGRWVYKGEWSQGVKGRYGCKQSTYSGLKYEGTWNDGIQDGYGVETYPDGGNYQGQWMRGLRHGYGVRQSVSYGIALRAQNENHTMENSKESGNMVFYDRDSRVEENRGGFVLQARTSLPEDASLKQQKRQGLFDKFGRPAFKRSLIRQKSASDLVSPGNRSQSVGPYSRASSAAGSVRSTTSAISQISSAFSTLTTGTRRSSIEEDDEQGSFCSDVDLANDMVTEKYAGEWKNDKRSGYGVCERSDGIKYEGEWLNNRKHGYGVTTLSDNTRVEGKYKNNVLVSSSKNSKFFGIRGSRVKDRVDAAVLMAHKSAGMANQKMEISNVRMTSARMKANQVDEVVKKANSDAEIARSVAQQYPSVHDQGSKIIANRQPSVELNQTRANLSQERNLEVRGGNLIEIDPKKQKKFTFFKFKKSQTRAKSETREINRPGGFTFFGRSSSIKKLPEHTSDYSPPDINLPFIQNAANTPNTLTNTANITLDINTGKKVTETQIQSPLYNNQAEKVHKSASNTLGPNNDSNVFKLHTPDVYTRTLHNRLNTDHSVEQSPEQTFKNRLNISNVNQNQSEIYPKITINSYANDNNMSKIDYNVTLDTFSGMSGKNEEFVRPSRQSNFYNSREALRNMHRRDNFVSEPTETTIEPWDNKQNNQPNALFKTSFNSRNQNSNMWNQYNAPVGDDFYNITNRNNLSNDYMAQTQNNMQSNYYPQQRSLQHNFLQQNSQKNFQQQNLQQNLQQQNLQQNVQHQILQQNFQQQKFSQNNYQQKPQNNQYLYDNYGRPYPDYHQVPQLNDNEDESLKERRKSLPSIVKNPDDPNTSKGTTSSGGFFSYASSAKPIQPAVANDDRYVIENGVRKRLKPVEIKKYAKTTADVPKYRLESLKKPYKRGDMGSMPNVSMVDDSEVLPREVVYQMSQQKREELMSQREEMERRNEDSILINIEDIIGWMWHQKLLVLVVVINITLMWAFYNLIKQPKK